MKPTSCFDFDSQDISMLIRFFGEPSKNVVMYLQVGNQTSHLFYFCFKLGQNRQRIKNVI